MKIPDTEVIVKITREVLTLFNIEGELNIYNDLTDGIVTTRLMFNGRTYVNSDTINPNELERAEIHRLVKRNLYVIFIRDFNKSPAPYGIMHGVRPTKIVHRWIRALNNTINNSSIQDYIINRLKTDYLVSEDKAELLTRVAIRQIPILNTSDEYTVSVYVGIPFCVTRCLYCSFPSNVLPDDKKIAEFMQVLARDVEAAKDNITRHGFKVQNIYIGGGTPTSLPDIFFAQMLRMIYNTFYNDEVVEFTVECGRPDTITLEKIAVMSQYRVTRVSVNPQSMQQRTLDIIGRRHTPEDIIRAFNELRYGGNWQINMDLILGLPGETVDDVRDSLEKVIALNPDDITIHALAIKRGSRLQMTLDDITSNEKVSNTQPLNQNKNLFNLPNDEEVRQMAKVTEELLRVNNFEPYYLYRQGYMSGQIENIGYCRDEAVGVYNVQIMDERQTIIGIGGAATTKVVDFKNNCLHSVFNAKDLLTYLKNVDYYIDKRTNLINSIYD
ncbi:MAG: coproporphyrinogen dehydrogenase HemZ [Selenomonadaceae bacterium]|nr:coproporphyrinogen dehydrogenase HemZ [Selenomonadaceae bacterium]